MNFIIKFYKTILYSITKLIYENNNKKKHWSDFEAKIIFSKSTIKRAFVVLYDYILKL